MSDLFSVVASNLINHFANSSYVRFYFGKRVAGNSFNLLDWFVRKQFVESIELWCGTICDRHYRYVRVGRFRWWLRHTLDIPNAPIFSHINSTMDAVKRKLCCRRERNFINILLVLGEIIDMCSPANYSENVWKFPFDLWSGKLMMS